MAYVFILIIYIPEYSTMAYVFILIIYIPEYSTMAYLFILIICIPEYFIANLCIFVPVIHGARKRAPVGVLNHNNYTYFIDMTAIECK